jgi:hypothetical protein
MNFKPKRGKLGLKEIEVKRLRTFVIMSNQRVDRHKNLKHNPS